MASFEECVDFASRSLGLEFSLKEKQLETLRVLFMGHDCVSVMPTGYGKSVIFQCLPWLFQCKKEFQHPLITVVVSPLTSLMQDQVMSLCERGIRACFLNCEGM
jgi:superfamily II DNA helicase RecQ